MDIVKDYITIFAVYTIREKMKFVLLILSIIFSNLYALARPVCNITKYDETSGMSHWRVTQMLQDKNGMMWFSTWNGLDRFDGYKFVNFKTHAGDGSQMISDRIRDLKMTSDGCIYCKADNGWFHFDTRKGKFDQLLTTIPDRNNYSNMERTTTWVRNKDFTFIDRFGTQWIVKNNGRLMYNNGTAVVEYPLDIPLPSVNRYMADKQNNLWLLTNRGVFKLTFSYNPATVLPQVMPTATGALYLDNKKRYWITTKNDATVRLFDQQNRLLGYLTPSGELTERYTKFIAPIYCITQTKSGMIMLGSKPGGIFILKERNNCKGFSIEHVKDIPCTDVYNLKEDSQGRIWIATMGGGICCMPDFKEPSQIISLTDINGYPDMSANRVRFIHITSNDVILATTTEGLLVGQIPKTGNGSTIKLRLHRKSPYRASSLSCNATMDILEDSKHRLFISTESGGICRVITDNLLADSLDFYHYNRINGLNSDMALALKEVKGQLLVVGSNQLMTINADTGECGFFGINFFGQTYHFNETQPLLLPDGRLLFGLQDGVLALSQEMMQKSSHIPPIYLTGIDKNGTGMDYAVADLKQVTLSPQERTVTIYFSALDYTTPADVSYALKMADDEHWNYIGHNRSASFVDLNPGAYILQIRSTNSDGVWVDNIRTLEIIVKPTFFESTTGRILLAILILTISGSIIYTVVRIRRIMRRQRETLEMYLKQINEMKAREDAESGNYADATDDTDNRQPSTTDSEMDKDNNSADNNLFMSRVMDYIEQNIGNSEANINDMAQAAATSRSGLNRKMKSIVGLTPADFLREARIKYACRLLETSDMSVSDVAYRCGFTDPKYFGKCFKASTGVSPTEYRNV